MHKLEVKTQISESVTELLQVERRQVHAMLRDKVRFTRLLKENPQLSIDAAALQAGNYKKSWAYGVFALYRKEGLVGLCTYKLKGRGCRLNLAQQQLKEQHLTIVLKKYYENPQLITSLCLYPYLIPQPN